MDDAENEPASVPDPEDELDSIAAQVQGHLRRLVARGAIGIPTPPRAPRVAAAPPPQVAALPIAPHEPAVPGALDAVRAELGDCQRCKLAPTRKNIVFGDGNPAAPLVFIGEAPGQNEDIQGIPFVGDAGQLLTKMIEAMGWSRDTVYIANILKCLRYNTLVQLENGSWERIGRLVRQRYAGRVMAVTDDGRLVAKQVTGWHESPLGGRRVFRLSYRSSALRGGNKAVTWLTHDHEVRTRRGWVRAEDLRPDDEVAIGQGMSRVARELATGTLLGDGSIPRTQSLLTFVHTRDQQEWVATKARALAELRPIVYSGETTARSGGRRHLVTACRTRATRALRVLRAKFYPEGKKVVPRDLVLTPRVFATWFLDDGYTKVKPSGKGLSEIAAHGFSDDDRTFLIERLVADLGLVAYTRATSVGRLHFGAEASRRLSEVVAPFCPPSMRYKLLPDVAKAIPFDPSLYEPGEPETFYDVALAEEVDFKGTDRTFYCIDVADAHNFVTSGGVVHNCRPPGNRNPEPDEIASCEPFLKKQLAALRPRIIVALGKFAAQWLTGKVDAPISALRGTFHVYEGIRVMPTYHPAYLLRQPAQKRTVWGDLQLVMAELQRLGITPPRTLPTSSG